ncbi:MAG: cytochrome c oxidase assembly factor Coa1 family protein [Planctomycetota bacterium]
MSGTRIKPGQPIEPPMQFKSDPFVAGDPYAPGRPWWVRHRMRALLATMLIPLSVGAVAFTATVLVVQSRLKAHPVFAEAMGVVRSSSAVVEALGEPVDPGFLVRGRADDSAGTAELQFAVDGPAGDAGVRVYAMREKSGGPWTITFLDVGLRAAGQVVVLRDGFKPAAFVEEE